MNLLEILKDRLTLLEGHHALDGIAAAARHIEIAENHYNRAIREQEEDSFNDVIYRTNQAFEGMLKEAYSIVSKKDDSKISPYAVERYFAENQIFKNRVMELLANYRTGWRNPSTHDHRLIFDNDEAILAISSVSAFAVILLSDILERVSFILGQEAARDTSSSSKIVESDTFGMSIVRQIIGYQNSAFDSEFPTSSPLHESEIIGSLWGYLTSKLPDLHVERDVLLNVNDLVRADFIVSKENDKTIIEVKKSLNRLATIKSAYFQVSRYLELANWRHGIVYAPPSQSDVALHIFKIDLNIKEEAAEIIIIGAVNEDEMIKALGFVRERITEIKLN